MSKRNISFAPEPVACDLSVDGKTEQAVQVFESDPAAPVPPKPKLLYEKEHNAPRPEVMVVTLF